MDTEEDTLMDIMLAPIIENRVRQIMGNLELENEHLRLCLYNSSEKCKKIMAISKELFVIMHSAVERCKKNNAPQAESLEKCERALGVIHNYFINFVDYSQKTLNIEE